MKKLTDQQKIDLVQKYISGEKMSQLAEFYNIDNSAVWGLLTRRNITIRNTSSEWRKFKLNENFFETINTQAKAYFLGLMFADGFVTKNHVAGITLQEKDKYILESFKEAIEMIKPLSLITKSKKNPKWSDAYSLNICSKKMCEDLIKLGCVINKTLILMPPRKDQIPDELIRHFIRGIFDGDGCIHFDKSKKNSALLNICGTKEILEFISDSLKKIGLKSNLNKRHKNNDKNNFTLQLSGNRQIIVFLDWLYEGSNLLLIRKFEKFKELKESMRNYKIKARGGFSVISNSIVESILNK